MALRAWGRGAARRPRPPAPPAPLQYACRPRAAQCSGRRRVFVYVAVLSGVVQLLVFLLLQRGREGGKEDLTVSSFVARQTHAPAKQLFLF